MCFLPDMELYPSTPFICFHCYRAIKQAHLDEGTSHRSTDYRDLKGSCQVDLETNRRH
jgi:hypothetical protein